MSPLPAAPVGVTARQALEAVLSRALAQTPCAVSFSGGRDSSALLAVAADVARREGLPAPIALTMRFPNCEDSVETQWQEMVLRHIGVQDWVRLSFDDELDIVGPHAQAVLRRHGVMWPPLAYSQLPLADQVGGGVLITGFGGDELLSADPLWTRVNQVIERRVRPQPKDLLRLAAFYGPRPVRLAGARRRLAGGAPRPWLLPAAQREVMRHEERLLAAVPLRCDDAIDAGVVAQPLPDHRREQHGYGRLDARRPAVPPPRRGVGAGGLCPRERPRRIPDPRRSHAPPGRGPPPGAHSDPHLEGGVQLRVLQPLRDRVRRRVGRQRSGPALVDVDVLRRMWRGPRSDARTYRPVPGGVAECRCSFSPDPVQ